MGSFRFDCYCRLGGIEKQANFAVEEKSRLSSQLRAKEEALAAAMNKKGDYNPKEVQSLEQQVNTDYFSVLSYCDAEGHSQ